MLDYKFHCKKICTIDDIKAIDAGLGGTLVTCSPIGPRIAGSNPAQTGEF